MSVGVLLITHQALGEDLLRIAGAILVNLPTRVEAMNVINDTPHAHLIAEGLAHIERLDQGDGVLILTDLYGATPSNVALTLLERRDRLRLVAGVNLPMLLRALNYSALDLETVAARAHDGGHKGILVCL